MMIKQNAKRPPLCPPRFRFGEAGGEVSPKAEKTKGVNRLTGKQANWPTNKGFTLIELLIATSIIAIIALSLYSAFSTGILSYRKIDQAYEVYQTARIVLNRMERDLKGAFAYLKDDAKFAGQRDSLDFFSVIDYYSSGKNYSNVCRIKYELSETTLKRTLFTGLEALAKDALGQTEELTSRIKTISFQYAYPTPNTESPYDWKDTWSYEADGSNLPLAVKIKLSLVESGSEKEEEKVVEFEKLVPLPLSE